MRKSLHTWRPARMTDILYLVLGLGGFALMAAYAFACGKA